MVENFSKVPKLSQNQENKPNNSMNDLKGIKMKIIIYLGNPKGLWVINLGQVIQNLIPGQMPHMPKVLNFRGFEKRAKID